MIIIKELIETLERKINNKRYENYSQIKLLIESIVEKLEILVKLDKQEENFKVEKYFENVLSDLSIIEEGSFNLIESSVEKGFNFRYLLYIPETIENNVLLMEGNNSRDEDKGVSALFDKSYIVPALKSSKLIEFFHFLKAPCMIPLLPRHSISLRDEIYKESYARQLSRNSVVNDSKESLYRLDLQILNAIEDAKKIVKKKTNIDLYEKTFLYGFSTSGNLAMRLAFLHPDKFCGVCAGGINAVAPVPISIRNNTNLIYPIGTYDYEKITGKTFPEKEYKELPKLYFMGDSEPEEQYNTILYSSLYDPYVKEAYCTGLARGMYERASLINQIYKENGYTDLNENIINILPNTGHNPEPMKEEIQEFALQVITSQKKSVNHL